APRGWPNSLSAGSSAPPEDQRRGALPCSTAYARDNSRDRAVTTPADRPVRTRGTCRCDSRACERGRTKLAGSRRSLCSRAAYRLHLLDAAAQPGHDRDRHTISQRLVARAIGALIGRLSAPRNQGVVVGEALQALALAR